MAKHCRVVAGLEVQVIHSTYTTVGILRHNSDTVGQLADLDLCGCLQFASDGWHTGEGLIKLVLVGCIKEESVHKRGTSLGSDSRG